MKRKKVSKKSLGGKCPKCGGWGSDIHSCAIENALNDLVAEGQLHYDRKNDRITAPVDLVNRPSHYNTGKIRVIDYLLDKFEDDALLFTVVKYISRAKYKGDELQDLQKAKWYLDLKIERVTSREAVKNAVVKLQKQTGQERKK